MNYTIITHKNLAVTVAQDSGEADWSIFLAFFPDIPTIPANTAGLDKLTGFSSDKEALAACCRFIDDHTSPYVEYFLGVKITVKRWWQENWGFIISDGNPARTAGCQAHFTSKIEAIEAAREIILFRRAD